jgi:excisionase family DNA binding protein
MHRQVRHRDHVAPPSGELVTDQIAQQLSLLPVILASLTEVRQILTGRLKSHLTVEEAAEELGRAPYTVRSWIREGRLPAVRVSGTGPRGRLLIARDDLQELVAGVA